MKQQEHLQSWEALMEGGQQEQGRLKHTRASRIFIKICYTNEKLMKKQKTSIKNQSFFAIV
jgi:hypothetical protein